MAYSYTDQVGDGVTRSFNFGFVGEDKGYIRASDIQVWTSPNWRGWQQVSGWTLSGTNQITFLTPPANGTTIRIRRVVDKVKPFAKFDRSVTLDMQSLNNAFIQMLEVSHEIMDGFFPAGFFFKDDLNMGGNSITNMREGVNGTDAVNFDQLQVQKIRNDQQDQRLEAIESNMVDNVGTRTVPYYLVAVGGETRWQLPLPFQSALVFINGVFQNQNLGAFSISGNGFNFAEPLRKGDEVYVLLGSGAAGADGYVTFTDLERVGAAGLIADTLQPVTSAEFAGGADPTGSRDSSAAFTDVYSKAEGGVAMLIPRGSYSEGGNIKVVPSDSIWLDRDFGLGVGVTTETRKSPLLITIGTPDDPVLKSEHTRSGINITAVGRGAQHIDCIRATTINHSTHGNGNTAIYAAALSVPGALWTAALHGETKHQGGTTSAISAESASYSSLGSFYGAVLNNTTCTAAETHPTTGAPATLHPSATALYITGSTQRGEMGQWIRGIRFSALSMRPNGTLVRDESAASQGWWSVPSSSKTVADILLEGTAPQGIVAQGAYSSGNAIRLASGLAIAYEGTGVIKTKYDPSTGRWGLFNGTDEKFSVNTTTGALYVKGVKVVDVQQPAIPDATAANQLTVLNAVLTVLRHQGAIAS